MKSNKPVIIWLLLGCVLLFIMVMVGGITRLTNSGLSMTDWHLITDTFPPTSEEKWNEAFEAYKTFPEYQKINQFKSGGFNLEDYKFIYFWEWFHRFIGRIIGVVFIIPFLYFLIRKKLDRETIKKCIILLGMGAFQGFLGWFMVKSGLIDNPDVSHFRLALHLTFAFITFAYTLWVALDLMYPEKKAAVVSLQKIARIALIALIIQIIYGGFVAGLDAGLVHNHWPLMSDGQFFHESITLEQPNLLLSFTEGKSGVQFIHRTFAYIVVFMMFLLYFKSRKFSTDKQQRNGLNVLIAIVLLQFTLGVMTLLFHVPLWLGLAHQLVAFVLLTTMVYTLHRLSK
ncbi:COX15/CtaA family protein [Flavobacterium sp. NRK F10]|uniref:COX15/CtaA family protein n=1 Tax=Flavobacterium sp. NRK F10 TaxID=2954931 RepID=UPI002090FF16|nr:COX15/CtaA family protein [Flavobacterium sp. NRK F10]MCO6173815.1 COX15/CtaA family protein [Flavobacterium sp. NRK F10]